MKKTYALLLGLFCLIGYAQDKPAADNAAEVAKKLANPVSSMISVPFQFNLDVSIGSANGYRMTTNFQPVVPVSFNEKLNLITRVVLPIMAEEDVMLTGKHFGLGDAVISGFFSPKESKVTWGIGPALLVPTATESIFGTGKFGVGPTAVALVQKNGFTYGALVNQIWSVAGNSDRGDVNQMFLQPFFAYNWPTGAGITLNMEMIQNWKYDRFTGYFNPVGTMVGKFGKQTVSFAIGPRIPLNGQTLGDWGVRSAITFVFPK
ncbi:transporter [Sediminicola luteus]|nr:transporter [Sediminicola luteus]